jgi:large subunit ribosomal protein L10
MTGEVVVLFGLEDPILPLKSLYNFSKDHENLKLIAGIFDNVLLGKEEVLAIAQLPSREELLARLVSNMASPVSGFLNVLQRNIKGLIFALKAIATNK